MDRPKRTKKLTLPPIEIDAKEDALPQAISNHLAFSVGKDDLTATNHDFFVSVAHVARDRMVGRLMETMRHYYDEDAKRVYYFSLEFLMGRALSNSLDNLGLLEEAKKSLSSMGLDPEEVFDSEPDAGLGNSHNPARKNDCE